MSVTLPERRFLPAEISNCHLQRETLGFSCKIFPSANVCVLGILTSQAGPGGLWRIITKVAVACLPPRMPTSGPFGGKDLSTSTAVVRRPVKQWQRQPW